jgi:hypothetical protein
LLLDHRQHEKPQLAVVERPTATLPAPAVAAARAIVAFAVVFAAPAVRAVLAVVVTSPTMVLMHVFRVWTASAVPVFVLHVGDIDLDISNVKTYRDASGSLHRHGSVATDCSSGRYAVQRHSTVAAALTEASADRSIACNRNLKQLKCGPLP